MHTLSRENVIKVLSDMVAIPSINPMGRPHEKSEPVERQVIEYLEKLFESFGVRMVRQRCSPVHESLLIFISGQTNGPVTLFESHIDTVPADEWSDRAFVPRLQDDVLFGCGACDDKGSLAAMALAILDLLECGTVPHYPVIFLAAGDEEYAQTGIKRFVQDEHGIGRAVFGEPTKLAPIIQHKGTVRWDISVHGRSAHSSRPELGCNAIVGMMKVVTFIQDYQHRLQRQYHNPLMTGPALTITMINGGRTRNAVPDVCTVALDFRILPGMKPSEERNKLIQQLDGLDLNLTHSDVQLMTPPLQTEPKDSFCQQILGVCRQILASDIDLKGVPYGTDAAWVSDRAPAVVLGPGSVDFAHIADERVDINEVVKGAEIYRGILLSP